MSEHRQFGDLEVTDIGKRVELEVQTGRHSGILHSLELGTEGGILIELLSDGKYSYFLSDDLGWIDVEEEP